MTYAPTHVFHVQAIVVCVSCVFAVICVYSLRVFVFA